MRLPQPIQTFFDADQDEGGRAPVDAFAPDAVVKDEGQVHQGHVAISSWWSAAKAEYQHAAKPLKFAQQNGVTTVRAKVTGNFPGSPAVLNFAFTLTGDRIAVLEIGS